MNRQATVSPIAELSRECGYWHQRFDALVAHLETLPGWESTIKPMVDATDKPIGYVNYGGDE